MRSVFFVGFPDKERELGEGFHLLHPPRAQPLDQRKERGLPQVLMRTLIVFCSG